MKFHKITFITTVFNEKKTINTFLDSLIKQTKLPDEVIIVDGGSTDKTLESITYKVSSIKDKKVKRIKLNVLVKKGNRSVGRNEAIKQATGDIIVCSDAGNILDKDWIKNIIKPFQDPKVDVVAGYYKGKAKNIFQKCVIPYALVMPDRVDPDNFLPATRSVAFKKSIWKKIGGFDESLSHNEDYVFARKLRDAGAKIVFAKDAIVYWYPRDTYTEAFIMMFRFALGDAESGIYRTNVLMVFARYLLGLYFLALCLLYKTLIGILILSFTVLVYIVWSIFKNYKYVKDRRTFVILPSLQFTADAAVLSGTLLGFLKGIRNFSFVVFSKNNKLLVLIVTGYVLAAITTLEWGIPNQSHPFPYHMDEWHQLQAVANTFRYGTPNVEGSANGTMLHFILSGIYLIPFMAVQYIDPFALQINNLFMRERVFEILRLQTILFGVLSIIVLYNIAKVLNVSKVLTIFLFTFTPIWLMFSGYFKYDIALMFWILLTLLFIFRFSKSPSGKNFILAGIPASLAFAVKVSAIPLLPLYILAYFLFIPNWRKSIKYLFLGVGVFLGSILLFGMPDTLFGRGNIYDYFYNNVITGPTFNTNLTLGMHPLVYLFIYQYPILFGHGLYVSFIFSIGLLFILMFKIGYNGIIEDYRTELFITISLILFIISILPLQLYAGGNRSLVALPFIVLIIVLALRRLWFQKYKMLWLSGFIIIIVTVQLFESLSWVYIRTAPAPQALASEWIKKNIPENTVIGVENIPIYQNLPDIIQKEFYYYKYNVGKNNIYRYQVVDARQNKLPSVIVITNGEIESLYFRELEKKRLISRLQKDGYKKTVIISPDLKFYRLFGNDKQFYFSWLVTAPLTTSVYTK